MNNQITKLNKMQWKINLTLQFDHNGKTLRRQKSHWVNFKSPILKNPLIKNQTVTSIRNLISLAYPKIPIYN